MPCIIIIQVSCTLSAQFVNDNFFIIMITALKIITLLQYFSFAFVGGTGTNDSVAADGVNATTDASQNRRR